MSLEDVEKIMDETQEAVEYQRVRPHEHTNKFLGSRYIFIMLFGCYALICSWTINKYFTF